MYQGLIHPIYKTSPNFPKFQLSLSIDSFKGIDIALFSAGGSISKEFAPIAAKAGCVVVDNSSAFRQDDSVPLVVPEINAADVKLHKGIIANPNCSTIIAILPLWPIHKVNPIRRLIAATYQAASGAGAAAMAELEESTRAYLEKRPYEQKVLPHPYAFNLFSHNTKIDPATGYNEEETKMVKETKKIFGDANIRVSATCTWSRSRGWVAWRCTSAWGRRCCWRRNFLR